MIRASWVTYAVLLLLGCTTSVQSSLTEEQANAVVAALEREGIGARKAQAESQGENAGFEVRVSNDDAARAFNTLRDMNVAKKDRAGMEELYRETGLVPTPSEDRAKWTSAVTGELEKSLEKMHGVIEARVHIAVANKEDQPLDAPVPRPRASVLMRVEATARVQENDVRALVAGAVEDMNPNDVTVIMNPVERHPTRGPTFTYVGPIAVASGSAGGFKAILGGAVALHILLAGALAFVLLQKRRDRRS